MWTELIDIIASSNSLWEYYELKDVPTNPWHEMKNSLCDPH